MSARVFSDRFGVDGEGVAETFETRNGAPDVFCDLLYADLAEPLYGGGDMVPDRVMVEARVIFGLRFVGTSDAGRQPFAVLEVDLLAAIEEGS